MGRPTNSLDFYPLPLIVQLCSNSRPSPLGGRPNQGLTPNQKCSPAGKLIKQKIFVATISYMS